MEPDNNAMKTQLPPISDDAPCLDALRDALAPSRAQADALAPRLDIAALHAERLRARRQARRRRTLAAAILAAAAALALLLTVLPRTSPTADSAPVLAEAAPAEPADDDSDLWEDPLASDFDSFGTLLASLDETPFEYTVAESL